MKKLILTLAISSLIIINAFSQRSKQESIRELFRVMLTDSMVDKMFNTMMPAMIKQSMSSITDSATKANSKELMEESMRQVKEMSKKMINEDMVILYDKYFTQDDIDAFISFYKSPAGQKYLKVMPDIQSMMMGIMMEKYIPEMRLSMEEIKKKRSKK